MRDFSLFVMRIFFNSFIPFLKFSSFMIIFLYTHELAKCLHRSSQAHGDGIGTEFENFRNVLGWKTLYVSEVDYLSVLWLKRIQHRESVLNFCANLHFKSCFLVESFELSRPVFPRQTLQRNQLN